GTPGYLSPEIADGKSSSEKTDWWGWAATMAFAATGRNPYGTGPLEAVLGRVAMGKFDLDGAPRNFVPLIGACLDPKPERRPSGQMILDALVDIESGRMPQLGSGPSGGAGGAVSRSPSGTAVPPGRDHAGAGRGGSAGGAALGRAPLRRAAAPAIRARTSRARTGRWAQPRSSRARVVRPITAVGAMSPAPGPLPGSTHRGVLRRSETPMATSRPARDPRWPGPIWGGRDS